MSKSIFISCVFEDNHRIEGTFGQMEKSIS